MSDPHPTVSRNRRWFTSSHSNGAGGECVECLMAGGCVLVRDSKRRGGPVMAVGGAAWQTFVSVVGSVGR